MSHTDRKLSGSVHLQAPARGRDAVSVESEGSSGSDDTESVNQGKQSYNLFAGMVNRRKTREHVIPPRGRMMVQREDKESKSDDSGDEEESGSGEEGSDSGSELMTDGDDDDQSANMQNLAVMSKAGAALAELKAENEKLKLMVAEQKEAERKGTIISQLKDLKEQGYSGTKPFHSSMSVQDLEVELKVAEAMKRKMEGTAYMKQLMLMAVGAIEWTNRKYVRMLQLDGWTEHVAQSSSTFDRPLARLADKYYTLHDRMQPEYELLLLLGGSAIMFHTTKVWAQQNTPSMVDIANANPELAEAVAKMLAERMATEAEENQQRSAQPTPVATDDDIDALIAESEKENESDASSQDSEPADEEKKPEEREATGMSLEQATNYTGLQDDHPGGSILRSNEAGFTIPVPDYRSRIKPSEFNRTVEQIAQVNAKATPKPKAGRRIMSTGAPALMIDTT